MADPNNEDFENYDTDESLTEEINAELKSELEEVVVKEDAKKTVDVTDQVLPESVSVDKVEETSANKVVDEISAKSGNKKAIAVDTPGFAHRIKHFVRLVWNTKKYRYMLFASIILLVLVLLFVVPVTRYGIFNTIGMRTRLLVIVHDESTGQPLKNATVSAAGNQSKTDIRGRASLESLKYGKTKLQIKQSGFKVYQQEETLGYGTNDFGTVELDVEGTQLKFSVKNWLDESAIPNAEVTYKESSALSDEKGAVVLTIEDTDSKNISVKIIAKGYLDTVEKVAVDESTQNDIELVIDRSHHFISQRNGKFDVYKTDLNGENQELALEASGSERPAISISQDPTGKHVALVSTRENKRNDDGFLLSSLYLMNAETGEQQVITTSESIELVGWESGYLVYLQVKADSSYRNPERYELRSLHVASGGVSKLSASNYFQDITIANGRVYFIPYDYGDGRIRGVRSVEPDGSEPKVHLNTDTVFTLYRTDIQSLVFSSSESAKTIWYNYDLPTAKRSTLAGEPANLREIAVSQSADKSASAWVEFRDGKGVLIISNTEDSKEQVLVEHGGLSDPIQWVGNSAIIFRVISRTETADYIVSVNGGDAQKIVDVYGADGVNRYIYN